jgi:hypothetical protein
MESSNLITINPQDVPEHIKLGQDNFNKAKYEDAMKEFKSILNVAPDNIEARVWLKKTQNSIDESNGILFQKVANPKIKELKERPGGQRFCLYCVKGDVSHRICSRLFQCKSCEFGQGMQDIQKEKLAARRDAAVKKEV